MINICFNLAYFIQDLKGYDLTVFIECSASTTMEVTSASASSILTC
jgi:hypothetical protein